MDSQEVPKEMKAVAEMLHEAKSHGMLIEVVWSALKSRANTIQDKCDFGINEWIK